MGTFELSMMPTVVLSDCGQLTDGPNEVLSQRWESICALIALSPARKWFRWGAASAMSVPDLFLSQGEFGQSSSIADVARHELGA
jgi:hypothetical protein